MCARSRVYASLGQNLVVLISCVVWGSPVFLSFASQVSKVTFVSSFVMIYFFNASAKLGREGVRGSSRLWLFPISKCRILPVELRAPAFDRAGSVLEDAVGAQLYMRTPPLGLHFCGRRSLSCRRRSFADTPHTIDLRAQTSLSRSLLRSSSTIFRPRACPTASHSCFSVNSSREPSPAVSSCCPRRVICRPEGVQIVFLFTLGSELVEGKRDS